MFKKVGSLDPHGGSILRTEILGNSLSANVGHAVDCNEGTLRLGTAAALIFGHIDGFTTNAGMAPTTNGNSGNFTMWFLTTATNASIAKMKAQVDISHYSLYTADPDATVNTTYGSGKLGFHTDIPTGGEFTDEDTAVETTAQYFIHGLDPDDSGNVIVNIKESEIWGGI